MNSIFIYTIYIQYIRIYYIYECKTYLGYYQDVDHLNNHTLKPTILLMPNIFSNDTNLPRSAGFTICAILTFEGLHWSSYKPLFFHGDLNSCTAFLKSLSLSSLCISRSHHMIFYWAREDQIWTFISELESVSLVNILKVNSSCHFYEMLIWFLHPAQSLSRVQLFAQATILMFLKTH